jgi:hypothetical protein
MTLLEEYRQAAGPPGTEGRLTLATLALILVGAVALAFIACALWPRWPDTAVAAEAPALPIVVAGVRFNVPPRAVRIAMQRRAGAQERIDLVYLWPSLVPPDPAQPLGERDRLFVTIASADALPPVDRLKIIYPRYTATDSTPGPPGLALIPFRDRTPYQGEDLAFDPEAPEKFLARCSRDTNPLTPATCLAERRVGDADLTLRFARDWLENWRDVEAGIERLIGELQAAGAS